MYLIPPIVYHFGEKIKALNRATLLHTHTHPCIHNRRIQTNLLCVKMKAIDYNANKTRRRRRRRRKKQRKKKSDEEERKRSRDEEWYKWEKQIICMLKSHWVMRNVYFVLSCFGVLKTKMRTNKQAQQYQYEERRNIQQNLLSVNVLQKLCICRRHIPFYTQSRVYVQ